MKEFFDIPQYKDWVKIEKINYGWSDDQKYFIIDKNNNKFLLRINSFENANKKKKEYEILKKFNQLEINMSRAIDFGICNNKKNVYMLLSWIEGDSLEDILPTLSEKEQYELGIKAGKNLKKIHAIAVASNDLPKQSKKEKKLKQLKKYEDSKYRIDNDEEIIEYIKNNIDIIDNIKPCYKHGDFHPGNMIYTTNKEVGLIDFNRWDCGDGYEEFYKIQSFATRISIPFSIGQINGYFDSNPPNDFWKIQSLYVAHASLYSIKWASSFTQKDIDNMKDICYRAIDDYSNFKGIVPKWYMEELINNKILKNYEKLKNIDESLKKLYPIAIVKDSILYVYDFDKEKVKYVYKTKGSFEGIVIPNNILAAFPLDFYHSKASAVISENALLNNEQIPYIFHEFVHCYQWESNEVEKRNTMDITKKYAKEKNQMWEITHPFPYENKSFVEFINNIKSAKNMDEIKSSHSVLRKKLSKVDYEYMTWQEYKEGYARYIENIIRKKLGMKSNFKDLKEPFNRVAFYELGSRYIKAIIDEVGELKQDELFDRISKK